MDGSEKNSNTILYFLEIIDVLFSYNVFCELGVLNISVIRDGSCQSSADLCSASVTRLRLGRVIVVVALFISCSPLLPHLSPPHQHTSAVNSTAPTCCLLHSVPSFLPRPVRVHHAYQRVRRLYSPLFLSFFSFISLFDVLSWRRFISRARFLSCHYLRRETSQFGWDYKLPIERHSNYV